MLETVREYAWERLEESGEAEAMRDRHAAYYAGALQSWGADLKGPKQLEALAEIEADLDNARTAWDWAMEGGHVARLDLAADGLGHFYRIRQRYQEAENAFRTAGQKLKSILGLEAADKSGAAVSVDGLRALVRMLTWQSRAARGLRQAEIARHLLQQSLDLLERPELATQDIRSEKAFVLQEMGWLEFQARSEEAVQLFEHSLALARALGDRWRTAWLLRGLGTEAGWSASDYDRAQHQLEESATIFRALGDRREMAHVKLCLGIVHMNRGQMGKAERLAREGLVILQELGGQADIADGIHWLSVILMFSGKFAESLSLEEESLAIHGNMGIRYGAHFWRLSTIHLHLGHYKSARTDAEETLTIGRAAANRVWVAHHPFLLGCAALPEGAYTEARQLLQEGIAAYQELGTQDHLVVAYAVLVYAACGLGQLSLARQHLYRTLRIGRELEFFQSFMLALPAVALLLAAQGEKERAVELYALASRYPYVANSRWFEDVAGEHIKTITETLPPKVAAAAQERGRARDLDATVRELLNEIDESLSD
jgi:tetratricopeptide (TPR) repeat protein